MCLKKFCLPSFLKKHIMTAHGTGKVVPDEVAAAEQQDPNIITNRLQLKNPQKGITQYTHTVLGQLSRLAHQSKKWRREILRSIIKNLLKSHDLPKR